MRSRSKWKIVPARLEESTQPICNPGRGWYEILTFRADGSTDVSISPEYAGELLDPADSLVLLMIQLRAGESLAQSQIDRFDRILRAFAGKRDILLRFVYDLDGKGMEQEPGRFDEVERHMEELAPLLRTYASSIYVYQGMLVGSWGEMHGSKFLSPDHVRRLGRRLLDLAGEKFFLAVRKPSQWRELFSEEQAAGAERVWVGLFNDGILGSETDLGTYGTEPRTSAGWERSWLPEEEFRFQEALCEHVPNGGEVVSGEETGQQPLESIAERLKTMHISYLNRRHDERVLQHWRTLTWEKPGVWQGVNGFDYIGCHLGYRFFVKRVWLRKEKEKDFAVLNVEIENVGFSCMYEQAELFLEHEDPDGNCQKERIPCDVRGWNGGTCTCISHRVLMRQGKFYLSLRRAKDQRKILFANVGDCSVGGVERVLLLSCRNGRTPS